MAHKIEFHHRAHEVSRLEAFSDVIFGFALSLLAGRTRSDSTP